MPETWADRAVCAVLFSAPVTVLWRLLGCPKIVVRMPKRVLPDGTRIQRAHGIMRPGDFIGLETML